MRKKWSVCLLWTYLALAVLLFSLAGPAAAEAYQLVSKTSSEEIITRGAVLQTVRMSTVEGPLSVYLLKADLSDPYLRIDTIIGSDGTLNSNQAVTEMARRTGSVAAVNGDFFQINESGRTIGLAYQGGRLVESPAQRGDMYGFGLTTDKTPLLEIFGFSGQVKAGNGKSFPLSGINKPSYLVMSEVTSDTDALTLYNSLWGAVSRGKLPNLTGVAEVVVKNGVVQQVLIDQPGVPIPADCYILKGHGLAAKFIKENLPKGAKVSFTYSVQPQGDKLFAAVGGQALLVEDGHLPAYFTQNISGRHARTAVGVSRDGKTLYLAAVEKQTSDGTVVSIGMTQEELAGFLVSAGVWRAVNLDGGGSTTMAARHLGDSGISLINRPQGISQRRVPDAIGIFSTAPQGKLSGLRVSGPPVVLIGRSGEFGVKGYDEYYNPVNVNPGEVEWSAKPEDGRFRGNVFTPSESGTFTIGAELGQASGTATLRVIGPESISQLAVSPAQINIEPGQSVQLSLQVKTYTGETFDLLPGDVEWDVDSTLGSIAAGKFTAVNNIASGVLKVDFHGVAATVPVTVKPSWVDLEVSSKRDSDISLDGWITVNFPAGSLSGNTSVRLAYAPAPADLPPGLSVLGTCTVNPLRGAALEGPWDLDWRYSKDVITSRPAVLHWDTALQQWREQPAEIEGDGEVRTISARLWSFGGVILVDDSRKAPSFKDTKGHWASQAISRLAQSGVVKGFPDGTFGPGQPVTRAQFVSLLAAALQWPAPEIQPSFKDIVPQWAKPAVAAAVSRGVVTGYPDGTFLPDAKVTRSEMAVMINRALKIGAAEEASYKDSGLIPAFALDDVDSVSGAGILQGSGGYFRPGDGATRAETAVAIDRVIKWWASR